MDNIKIVSSIFLALGLLSACTLDVKIEDLSASSSSDLKNDTVAPSIDSVLLSLSTTTTWSTDQSPTLS